MKLKYFTIFTILSSLTSYASSNPVGSCSNLDTNLYYCKPFSCNLDLPIHTTDKINLKFEVLGSKDKKCGYNLLFSIKQKGTLAPIKYATKCELSGSGKVEAIKEFISYKNGLLKIYMQSTMNPLLKKECTNMLG